MGAFYICYANLVEISFRNQEVKNISLECEGCDFIEKVSSVPNHWIVRVDSIVPVKLIVNRKGKQVAESSFKVFAPPLPIVYLDGINAQSVISRLPGTIHLEPDPSVPLKITFGIVNWTIRIEDKLFSGIGKQITEEVLEYMKSITSGILKMDIKFYSPFGMKEIKEMFEFKVE